MRVWMDEVNEPVVILFAQEVLHIKDDTILHWHPLVVEQDPDYFTDGIIIFKCPYDRTPLVLTSISTGHRVVRFEFICPKCGTTFERKYVFPVEFGDPKTIEEKLFETGVRQGWISKRWRMILKFVRKERMSDDALWAAGVSRKYFVRFSKVWRRLKGGRS